ncbi:CPA2 family monovalent cation:H+ antiporter-2 [Alkalibacillus filiformis]|uniref:CPA2 family monovalent cation:H+ antiporter-2 n=1 Tax=Alkalibacillus filiformis TaxID=200990 RepID=A0ABU0DV88_9BACI|nr:cation:proton antiporter [Alkalibacillus filiformis]MDQ0352254.1 CPA2 family monovalent cation:H+ antiporter-2 [Alkalibacillus filiformis]
MYIPDMLLAGLLFLILFMVGYISFKVRIPNVITFLLLGLVIGSFFSDSYLLEFAGEIGIVLLFFMLGMEFPVNQLVKVAKKVLGAGILDLVLSFGVSFGIALLFGLDWITAMLIGGVAYATSSSITAKLLESTKRMANKESEFILGLLIFEDLVAPVLVAILVGLTAGAAVTAGSISLIILQVILLTAGALFLALFVFRKLRPFVDRYINEDFFVLFVIGIGLTYGGLALFLDLSEVLGAFLAGIVLAELKRTHELEHLVLNFRDLLLPLFFVYFGTSIEFAEGIPMVSMLIVLLVWSIIAKIAVGYWGGQMYGMSKKVSLRAGFSLTQRGEFSIIMAALASEMIMAFSSVFILTSAILGVVLFQNAPVIARRVFGKREARS